MKSSIIILFLIFLNQVLTGQEFDTIPIPSGYYQNIEEPEFLVFPADCYADPETNEMKCDRITINESGDTITTLKYEWLEGEEFSRIKRYKDRKVEETMSYQDVVSNKYWFPNGNLKWEYVTMKDGNYGFQEERAYYDNDLNSLIHIWLNKYVLPLPYQGIVIENSRDDSYHQGTAVEYTKSDDYYIVEQEITEKALIPVRQIWFHENGEVSATGEYSRRVFHQFRNKEFYDQWLKTGESYIDNYTVILSRRFRVKHGIWKYFDKSGNLIREAIYIDGVLIESKSH